MIGFIIDVASMVVRWLHIITGIAWVGASFYFIWLDNSLEEAPSWKKEKGIKGDLWSFHGGGIYEVAKYKLGPSEMPQRLHWFYWEAYSTWLTGMALLILVYYLQASTYLLAPDGNITSAAHGIGVSLLFIVSGYLGYEVFVRIGMADRVPLFLICMTVWISMFSWLSVQVFADRAAYIHMGILLGTIMVANVFFGIIPPQRKFVKAINAGLPPDAEGLRMAKLRSTHNNYFTLPVLFCMISNHYPFLYGHRYNWLILIAICLITAAARQFFNLRHKGIFKPGILVVCAALFVALMGAVAWDNKRLQAEFSAVQLTDLEAITLINTHCISCHAAIPTYPGMVAPPLGVVLTTLDAVRLHADKAKVVLAANYMPLGNLTGLAPEQRQQLVQWFAQMNTVTTQ